MTWNGQFHLIHNFSNLFPPKLLRMTENGQFCMAKIKCTVIQGNFYERLPFYMDSCALSPMASLFLKMFFLYTHTFQKSKIQMEKAPLFRVATAQGKQGIWLLTFPDRENTGNLVNFIFYTGKIVATQGKF